MTRGLGRLLNTELEVWLPQTTTDAGGGQTLEMVYQATEPGRLSQPSAAERETAQAERGLLTHNVYLEPGTAAVRGAQLRRGGLTLTVLATVVPSEPWYCKAECESVQPPAG